MTAFAFTELFGGAVYQIDDLDSTSIAMIGGSALSTPSGPARDAQGTVTVAAMTGHQIAQADPGASWVRFGTHGSGVGQFDRPAATAFLGSGHLLVLDAGNGRLVRVDDIAGSGWRAYGHRAMPTAANPAVGAFADPRGLAVDSSDRIWISDPAAKRVVRVDGIDGSGWAQIPLPAGANHALPYGICAYQDVVMVMDVANSRLIRIEEDLATVVDLSAGSWIGPTFVTALGDNLVVADVRGNALLLLEPDGDGFLIADSLRGSPPDSVVPRFDSLGGVGS